MTTLIIGGGLSGLALAHMLEIRGQDYLLLEARNRFGGRIKTHVHDGAAFDLGPAWFWPAQPRIAALIDTLRLQKFDQYATGDLTYQDETGTVQRGLGYSSMEGSWRLTGGFSALTDALADRIPNARKRLNAQVENLAKSDSSVTATLKSGETITGKNIVLALPPRLAATLSFSPPLSEQALHTMQNIPTWMAGQAKAMAIYDTPFWRDAGLSGDAMSRHGPLVEIHDASPAPSGPFALFGFIGVAPQARTDTAALTQSILAQLGRLFGPQAAHPKEILIKDWAQDPATATPRDAQPLYAHPTYSLPPALTHLWDGTVHFAGTEVAPQFGGFLEGAIEAAEAVARTLKNAD